MGKGGRLYERENKENSHPAMHGKRINPMSGCFGIQKNHCRRCLNDYHHPCFAVYDRMGPPVTIFRQTAVTDGYFSCCCRFGRIPFAALPGVQPTSFLVMVSGLVFGPQAGFMIGAMAALASNFFLGQGPWTPWQMLGWGLMGMSAAGLTL
jgi:hypothetical protein